MNVLVNIEGCDDTTSFVMQMDENELEVLKKMSIKAALTSDYCCMPTISLYQITDEEAIGFNKCKEIYCLKNRTEEQEEWLITIGEEYSIWGLANEEHKIFEPKDIKF